MPKKRYLGTRFSGEDLKKIEAFQKAFKGREKDIGGESDWSAWQRKTILEAIDREIGKDGERLDSSQVIRERDFYRDELEKAQTRIQNLADENLILQREKDAKPEAERLKKEEEEFLKKASASFPRIHGEKCAKCERPQYLPYECKGCIFRI